VPIQIRAGIELTSGVAVTSPRGYRVEGLNLEEADALLRELRDPHTESGGPRVCVSGAGKPSQRLRRFVRRSARFYK
jgi:hypothetical protein